MIETGESSLRPGATPHPEVIQPHFRIPFFAGRMAAWIRTPRWGACSRYHQNWRDYVIFI